ncbi:MAG: Response regulator receiver domain [Chloroflexota bacterium]|jgi:DNA-binding NtrC family response regulator|nr:Response regulator receiver domain [Chloroflexota bacterium]
MYNQVAVLILEDDVDQLAAIRGLVENSGLRAVCAENPSKALRLMEQLPPVLAVIDRDMSQANDRERTSLDVLAALDRRHPTCTVFVYSNAIGTLAQQAQVWAAHKSAILHEKRFGADTLLRRIRQFVTPTIGDLEMRDGTVRNRMTGAIVTHRVACALMMAYPRALTLASADQVKAAQRFREWLGVNSRCVTLVAKGNRLYELVLDVAVYRALMPEDEAAPDLDAETLEDFENLTN